MMKNVWKRTLSLFLALVMLLSNVPMSVLAEDGVESFECDHVNAQVAEFTDATCGADGCELLICADCGAEWEETVPATGMHNYVSEVVAGATVYTCQGCGDSYEEACTHANAAVTDAADASCGADGYTQFTCSDCGNVWDETVEATGDHAYSTEEVDGNVIYTCDVCGDSYTEAAAAEEVVVEETVAEETKEVVEELPVISRKAVNEGTEPDGIAWINASDETTEADMIPIVMNKGIKKAVMRAIDRYDELDNYTVYYIVDGTKLDVGDPVTLVKNMDKARALADDMKEAVRSGELLPFTLKSKSGNEEVVYIECKSYVNTDIENTVVIENKKQPAGDLQDLVEEKIWDTITVDGFHLYELPEYVDVTLNGTYKWPEAAQSKEYNYVISVEITEGMTGETKVVDGGTVILKDTTPVYTVTYYTVPGEVYETYEQIEDKNTPVPEEAPYREHYIFQGWDPAVAGTVTDDAAYTAKWLAEQDEHTPGSVAQNGVKDNIDDRDQKFVVTYYDGLDEVGSVDVPYGDYTTHPNMDDYNKPGYRFKKWVFAAGSKSQIYMNTAYNAEWEKIWNVTFDPVAAGEKTDMVLVDGAVIKAPADPVREGYKFDGWEGYVVGTKATADVTYTAKWIKLHTITFMNEKEEHAEFVLEDGAVITAPADPVREGYKFAGWDGYEDGAKATKDAAFKAIWKKLITYTYTDETGTFADFTKVYVEGETIVHPAVSVAPVDHVFDGWIVNGTTCTAKWQEITPEIVIVTYTFSDGVSSEVIFEDIAITVVEGSAVLNPADPVRDGYRFDGWKQTDETTHYEAAWVKVHTITFVVEGVETDIDLDDGAAIKLPADPVREGYKFDGWDGYEAGATATADKTYTAKWVKLVTITYTDGCVDEDIFADFEVVYEAGQTISHPTEAPAERNGYTFDYWTIAMGTAGNVANADATYKAEWAVKTPETVRVTYFQPKKNGTGLGSANEDVKYNETAPADGLSDYVKQRKTAYLGWYLSDAEGNLYVESMARAAGLKKILSADVDNYVKTNILPPPLDLSTMTFTEDTYLRLICGADENQDGHIDGAYEYDANGKVILDSNGDPKRDVQSKYLFYSVYDETKDEYRNALKNKDFTAEGLEVDTAAMESVAAIPNSKTDGKKFVKWIVRKTEYETIDSINVGATHYVIPQWKEDANNNDVFDKNEEATVVIYVNGKTMSYADFVASGIGSIEADHLVVAEEKKPGAIVLNSVEGTNITITSAANYLISNVILADKDYNNESTLSDQDAKAAGIQANIPPFTAADALDATSTSEYIIEVYFNKIEAKGLTIGENGKFKGYTDAEVYEAATGQKVPTGETATVKYVAREAGERIVNVEALYRWIGENYTAQMVSMLDSFASSDLTGIEKDANGEHIIKFNLGEKKLPVSADVDFEVKSAQDIANKRVNDYINLFVDVMKTDPESRDEDDKTPFDMILDIAMLKSDIMNAAEESAEILPFGYNAAGDDMIEILDITCTGMGYSGNSIPLQLSDVRADSNLSNKGTVKTVYGASIKNAITSNVTSAASGLVLPVSYATQAANTYDYVSVIFPGSKDYRPDRTTFTVDIAKADAQINLPGLVYKEHNAPYTADNNPAPKSVPADLEVISIIAGLDLNAADIDVALSTNPSEIMTIANANGKVWVKLPNTILNLLDLVKDFAGNMDLGFTGTMKQLLDFAVSFDTNNTYSKPLDEAVEMLQSVADINDTRITQALDMLTASTDGDIEVVFSDAYPEDPGIFLNMAVATDANYKSGLNQAMQEGKDYGLILVSPVLCKPNNGVQLYSDEMSGTPNIFTLKYTGKPHALKVQGHDDAEVYYYGFNNALAVHYDGGTTAPTEAGMYLVSTVVTEKDASGNTVISSDMAVMLIGIQKSEINVERTVCVWDGMEHEAAITVKNQDGEDVTASARKTVITGRVEKPDNAGLSELQGIVNIDMPAGLDNLWNKAASYLGNGVDADITKAEVTPAVAKKFFQWCKDQINADKLDEKLAGWGVPDSIVGIETPEVYAVKVLDQLIDVMDRIIDGASGDIVSIQFKNNVKFTEAGVYLYYGIVTDPNYIPSENGGVLIIHAAEEDFVMEDQTVYYNGQGQLPVIEDKTGREHFMIVYKENMLSFIVGNNTNAIVNKLEEKFPGFKSGMTVGQLFEGGEERLDALTEALVEGLFAEADKVIKKLHVDENSVAYKIAKEALNARINAYKDTLVEYVENTLRDASKVINDDTVIVFNEKPVDPDVYKVHAFSYALAHEEANFTILEKMYAKVAADAKEMAQGNTVELTYTVCDEDGNAIAAEDLDFGITIKVMDGENEVTDLSKLAVGEYDIVVTATKSEKYDVFVENAKLTVKKISSGQLGSLRPTLILESEVYNNFYTEVTGFETMDNLTDHMYLLVWDTDIGKDNSVFENADHKFTGAVYNKENGMYSIRADGVSASRMGDNHWYKICVQLEDGSFVYSPRARFSPKRYTEQVLVNNDDKDLMNLCVALMNYGADVQLALGYKTTDLMNAFIDPAIQANLDSYSGDMITDRKALDSTKVGFTTDAAFYKNYVGNSMALDGKLALNFDFSTTANSLDEAGLLVWTEAQYNSLQTLTYENATKISEGAVSGGAYRTSYSGIKSSDMGDTIYFAAYVVVDGEYIYSPVARRSLEYCAKKIMDGQYTAEWKTAMESMVVYGNYALKYFP